MSGPLIVIDGPAGAGKSTVARRIAEHFGAQLLDTGAIYRSLALVARRQGVDWDDEAGLAGLADQLRIGFRPAKEPGQPQRVLVLAPVAGPEGAAGDEPLDVTKDIRTPDMSEGASRVSKHAAVRAALLGIQRAIAARAVEEGEGCVAEGRDMGTVVFPDARYKFFLTASQAARVARRHRELLARGHSEASAERVEAEMKRRDQRDSSRETAPLQRADDAVLVDSSELDIGQVVARILAAIAGA
jgi:cytidylate kinase